MDFKDSLSSDSRLQLSEYSRHAPCSSGHFGPADSKYLQQFPVLSTERALAVGTLLDNIYSANNKAQSLSIPTISSNLHLDSRYIKTMGIFAKTIKYFVSSYHNFLVTFCATPWP